MIQEILMENNMKHEKTRKFEIFKKFPTLEYTTVNNIPLPVRILVRTLYARKVKK